MNKLSKLLQEARQYLAERMTFKQLMDYAEPRRVARSQTVRGGPLKIETFEDSVFHIFNFKSFPSTTGKRHHGYIKFFKPRSPRPLEELECMVDCTCFSGDALVLMSDGVYKPIKDVVVGDLVYTHTGSVKRVLNVSSRTVKEGEHVWNVHISGSIAPMTVTGNHPFYALRGNDEHLCEDKSSGHFEWVKVDDFKTKEWFLSPWLSHSSESDVDLNFARLVGYYASRGFTLEDDSPGNTEVVGLAFNTDETNALVDVQRICQTLGYKCRVAPRRCESSPSSPHTSVAAFVYNLDFAKFCCQHVGSHAKKFSAEVMDWSLDGLVQLCVGLFGGVKCFSKNAALASQVSTILRKLRIQHGLRSDSTEAWIVSLNEAFRPLELRAGSLVSLVSREPNTEFSGLVYDITVEDDHSFIANGVAVHNCPDFRYRYAWAVKQRGSSVVGPQSMNRAWNRAPRITNPGSVPGICKHIIRLKDYITGLTSDRAFGQGASDTSSMMRELMRYADGRWTDTPDADQEDLDREAAVQLTRLQRNRGQLPSNAPPPPEPQVGPSEPEGSVEEPLPSRGNPTTAPNSSNQPNPTNGFTAPEGGAAPPPSQRRRTEIGDSVDRSGMNKYAAEIKLCEELEAEEVKPSAPELTAGQGDESSDKSCEALELLRQIRDFLASMAKVKEPEPGEPEPEEPEPEEPEPEEPEPDEEGTPGGEGAETLPDANSYGD